MTAPATKRPRGRPRTVGDRTRPIFVRVSPEEYARIASAADRLGVSAGVWVRMQALAQLPPPPPEKS